MAKRTQAQIEKDYKEIKKAAETAKSFKELEEMTGLSHTEIIVSLQKHPRVYARIKKQMEVIRNDAVKVTRPQRKEQYVVIDASITTVPNIEHVLENESKKIIITSITVRELARIQRFQDKGAMRARHILLMAAEKEEKFEHKLINEDFPTPDDSILDFCLKNKDCVTLYTSDKEMYNLAKVYSIPAEFFKGETEERNTGKLVGLQHAQRIGNKLIIDLDIMNQSFRTVKVISNGIEYEKGIVELAIGDEILLASKKREGYVSFAHYQVVSLNSDNNCNMIFSKRIYDLKNLDVAYKYKSFLRDFKRKVS